ncbi:Rho GTPase-activating protein 10 [Lemmus lemmus]
MGLQPLEFSDCYLDSPWFRERIRAGSGAGEDQQVLQRAHQRWEEPHRCHQKTALHYSCAHNHPAVVMLLVSHTSTNINSRDDEGCTPLIKI